MSAASQLRLAASTLLSRWQFARQNGLGFAGARNYYEVLGYDEVVTSRQYRQEYARGGIAKRIVEAFPKATWRGGVELFEDEDPEISTEFEKAWTSLEQRLNIWSLFQKADILAGLSTFSTILIGAPGDLGSELPKGTGPDQILYLTPFWGGGGPGLNTRNQTMAMDADCRIATFDDDVTSPRFGEPLTYNLKRVDVVNPAFQRPVHWSRIIHLAEGCLDDNVYGTPTLENVWNLLQDLMKVTGGGAEAFWLRANQGIQLDINKDMALPPSATELADLKAQAEDYKHQLTRMMRTRGVDINQLGSDVANFSSPAEAILTQIAGSKGIPMRILTGSERGELASSQDAANFSTQVQDRRTSYAGPMIVRRFVDRLIEFNYLPTPKSYEVGWPTIETMTDMEKAAGAEKWASTNATAGMPIYTDAEIREHWHGFKPLTDEQKASMQPPAPVEPPVDEAALAAEAAALEAQVALEEEAVLLKAAQDKPRKFSSTQVQLPSAIAKKLLAYGRSIPDADLAEDGREDDPHVTVKYGLHTNDAAEVDNAVAGFADVALTLGKTTFFKGDGHDVLYVAVESPDLAKLNKLIASKLEVTDTHPKYVPHACVAYLKPGLGKKYAGDARFEGLTASLDTVVFSDQESGKTPIQIGLRAAEDTELVRVLAAAIEAGNGEVVAAIVGLGGPGSGNFGHGGRPGQVGGSGEGGGKHERIFSRSSSEYGVMYAAGRDTREQFSDGHGNYSKERAELHGAIISKHMKGTTPVEKPVATILGGGPASGKSELVKAEGIGKTNTVLVDVDDIRTSLPEYRERVGKDTAVSAFSHEESSDISKQLLRVAAEGKRNVVLDGTGDSSIEKLGAKAAGLRSAGHEVVGTYVTVDVETAVERAEARGKETGRYVPETFIRETHAAVSRTFPEAIKQGLFDRASLHDTNDGTKLIASAVGKELTVHDQAAWNKFLAKGQQ